ncbi:MAG: RDD family protein [Pyrinomonadaceae bacterium]
MENLVMVVGDASKSRLIAVFLDHFIAAALMLFVVALVPERLPIIKAAFFFLTYLAYFVVLEALWSRTLGKYFQGLIVRKLDGGRCDWRAALIRGGLRVVEVNPLLLGGLPAGLFVISTDRKQRLGDILAGTVVVSDKVKWGIDAAPLAAA